MQARGVGRCCAASCYVRERSKTTSTRRFAARRQSRREESDLGGSRFETCTEPSWVRWQHEQVWVLGTGDGRLVVLDGCVLDVADTRKNERAFGRPVA